MTDTIFSEANRLPRDIAEDWFKFANVGDQIGGTIQDMFEKPESAEGYPAQRCFTLLTEDGKVLNVGVKRNAYILTRTDMLQVGDTLGIRFAKEVPSKFKAHPAKSMIIFTKLNRARIAGMQARDLVMIKEEPENEETKEEDFDLE